MAIVIQGAKVSRADGQKISATEIVIIMTPGSVVWAEVKELQLDDKGAPVFADNRVVTVNNTYLLLKASLSPQSCSIVLGGVKI